MKQKPLIPILLIAMLCLVLCGCGPVSDAESAIDSIKEVTIESHDTIEKANEKYAALSEEEKDQVSNYSVLEEANKKFAQIMYSELSHETEKAHSLLNDFFARYYDTSSLEQQVSQAETAMRNSNYEQYYSIYSLLSGSVSDMQKFIKEQAESSYSAVMNDGDAPFAVPDDLIPAQWSFKTLLYQSINTPQWITSTDNYPADRNAVIPFVNGSGRPYSYSISTVPIIEIAVQGPDKELYKAYVNSEVNFTQLQREEVNRDSNREMIERPGYFLVTQKGALALALKSFDGDDYYILYAQ